VYTRKLVVVVVVVVRVRTLTATRAPLTDALKLKAADIVVVVLHTDGAPGFRFAFRFGVHSFFYGLYFSFFI